MKRKGIRALLAILLVTVLMTSFSAPAFACHDYTKPQTAKYTVYYKEYGTNTQLAPYVTKSATVGKTVTESAIDISGYTVYGQSTKSLYIRKSSNCYSITFYYQKQQAQTTDYYVRYLEYETEAVLAPEKHVENQAVGSIVTETAIDIPGYRLVGSDTQTLELKACGTSGGSAGSSGSESGSSTGTVTGPVTKDQALQIALAHAGLSSSSVKDIEIEKDYEHGVWVYEVEFECRHGYEYEYDIECSTGKILDYEWEHNGCSTCKGSSTATPVLTCPVVPTCDPVTPTPCPGEDTEACNVITFYYEKIALADYTVKYLDKDTGDPVAAEKTQTGLEVGASVTEAAIPVDGYTALDPTEATLVLAESGNEIIFYYEKDPVLTSYEVRYLEAGTDMELAESRAVADRPVGSEVTESAIFIEGYNAIAPTEVTITLEENGNVIIFYYEKQIALTDYTVKYLDKDTNAPVAPDKVQTDLEVGTSVTESAIPVDGYTAVDPTEVTITLAESGNEIIFYYEKLPVLTDYTVRYLDRDSNAPVAVDKVETGLEVGTSVSESAIPIGGYAALAPTEMTIVLAEEGNVITFYYQKLTSYTIHYVDEDSGEEIAPFKTVTDMPVGETITEYAKDIFGYMPEDSSITFTLLEGENNYTIYYYSIFD